MKKEKIRILVTLVSNGFNDPLQQSLQQVFLGQTLYAAPGVRVMRAAPGVLIQLCGPGAQAPSCLVPPSQLLISYAVSNLNDTIAMAREHGATIIQQTTDCCSGRSICYLQFSNEQIVGFFSNG